MSSAPSEGEARQRGDWLVVLMSPKLDPERAALVVIDVQEAFRKAIPDFAESPGRRRR